MKKYLLIVGLALISFSSFAQTKVGTIDADYIAAQLPEMTQVEQGLQTYNEELQAQLQSDVTKYETLVDEYKTNSENYTETQKKEKQTEIISLENSIKGFRQKATVMMQMKRNELTQPLYEKINQAMMQVVQEENFTHIMQTGGSTLAFAAIDYDITDKVLKKRGVTPKETTAKK